MSRGYKLYFAFGIVLAIYTSVGLFAFHTIYVKIRLIEGEKTSVTFFRFFDEKLQLGTTFAGFRRRETDDLATPIPAADATLIEIGVSSRNEGFQRYRAISEMKDGFHNGWSRILVAVNEEERSPTSPDKKSEIRFHAGINTLHFKALKIGPNVEGEDISLIIPAHLGVKEGSPQFGFLYLSIFWPIYSVLYSCAWAWWLAHKWNDYLTRAGGP